MNTELMHELGQPWAITPDALNALVAAASDPTTARPGGRGRASIGTVAVLPLYGTLRHRGGGLFETVFGGTSLATWAYDFRRAVSDPGVTAVVIDVDSPGGSVAGVPELADEIYRARSKKRIIAVANHLAASAAYWLASQAHEIVASPSAQVGSIGVLVAHEDVSRRAEAAGIRVTVLTAGKYKGEGHPFAPLSDSARAHGQAQLDDAYSQFVAHVARGRGVTGAAVRNGYGEGRSLLAQRARAAGLVDRVATLKDVLDSLTPASGARTTAMAHARRTFALAARR